MKEKKKDLTYTKCFIAIAPPADFQSEYARILKDAKILVPSLHTWYPKIPHITLCRIMDQKQNEKLNLLKTISLGTPLLAGQKILIGGLGIFGSGEPPQVLYLSADVPSALREYLNLLVQNLNGQLSRRYQFIPHITVGSVNDEKAQKMLAQKIPELKELLDINFKFPIREITLFGRNGKNSHAEFITSVFVNPPNIARMLWGN